MSSNWIAPCGSCDSPAWPPSLRPAYAKPRARNSRPWISSPRSTPTNCSADRIASSSVGTNWRVFAIRTARSTALILISIRKMNRALVYELATARFIAQREDALFLGPPGTGKSHLAQAIGHAAIQQGYRVIYREAHTLLEELTDATLTGTRKAYVTELATVPLLIIDDLGMRKLAHTAAEDLLEVVMRRYERASTLLTSNRPVDDWGKLLGDTAAVTALLDRLLHHAHVLKCGPRSWRTKLQTDLRTDEGTK